MTDYEELADDFAARMQENAEQRHDRILLEQITRHQAYRQEIQKSQQAWLRFLVATSGTVFAILISFADKTAIPGHARQAYGLAIASLGCGILMLCIALYERPFHDKKNLLYYSKETKTAEREGRKTDAFLVYKTPSIFGICAIAGYIFLSAAVLLLTALLLLLYVIG